MGMTYHIEEYHFGFVVCYGRVYGPAVSKAFITKAEAEAYLEKLLNTK